MKFRLTSLILLTVLFLTGNALPVPGQDSDREVVIIRPEEYDRAFPNPMKGFRSSSTRAEDYPTLTRLYIRWNEIEDSENDGIRKIVDYCNEKWKDLPGRNVKVIPRVYLEWPYPSQNTDNSRDTVSDEWGEVRFCERYWPSDMTRGDYSSRQFRERVASLIEKMGRAWDKDPRVAYIEMGLIGWWGEQHSPSIDPDMQKLLGEAFLAAFPSKLVMIRYGKDFTAFPFGSYWDSFAHANESFETEALMAMGEKWKHSVRGGELAYNWGDLSKSGRSPDESLKVEEIHNYLIDHIRMLHWNHLGWINDYDPAGPGVRKGAEEVQKNLGYRFVLDEIRYPPVILPGNKFTVHFTVRNTGSSPFYYDWPVEIGLLDPRTREPVWKDVFRDADIREWLPGDEWDSRARKYSVEPDEIAVSGTFILPDTIKAGEYILSVSILDPAGNVPSVRFAIKNYHRGGRHPLGRIGVNMTPENHALDGDEFDDLYDDRSLHYVYSH